MIEPSYIILLLAASVALLFAGLRLPPEWKEEVPWSRLIVISSVVAFICSTGAYLLSGQILPALSVLLISWMLPTTLYTDYALYKIPRGISRLTYLLALIPLGLAAYTIGSATPLIMSGLFLLLPGILLFARGIGLGDIRLFVLFALALPWWTGMYSMIIALFAAVVLQLIAFGVAKFTGQGQARTIKTLSGEEKVKRALPFGPALLVAFLATGLVVAGDGPVDCSAAITCLDSNLLR